MRTVIVGRSGSGIPGPLVHRDEMDVRLLLDQSLSPIAMVNIPVDNKDPLQPMLLPRVVRSEGDVSEKAETHCPIVDRVVTRRTDGREAALMDATDREIDRRENAAGTGGGGVPGTAACHRVRIEAATPALGHVPHGSDVSRIVRELQLLDRRVPAFELFNAVKELRILPQRSSDCSQA